MRNVIWLVWDGQTLLGLFAVAPDADRRATHARVEQSMRRQDDPQGHTVRVEPWTVAAPDEPPHADEIRAQRRTILERVDSEWGLLDIPSMGTAHFPRLDTYLVVPYRNTLVCPAFQFDHSRVLWPGFRDVLALFRDAGWDDFSIMVWFVTRQGVSDGDTPALLIRDEPDGVLEAVRVTAARR